MTWITETADRIEAERDAPYVVKGGVSPSGTIHVGHLNELLLPYFVAEELRSRDYRVTQYMTVDDLDPNVDNADAHVDELERVINALGIDVHIWRASDAYGGGAHLINLSHARKSRSRIESIVSDYQDTEDFQIFDGEKMPWRLEWAAQWATLEVDFEPYGKDHAEGSFESAARIAEAAFGIEPPVDFVYEWFTLDGAAMSSSSGVNVSAEDVLRWICPQDLMALFRRNPQKQRDFSVEDIPSMVGSVIEDGPTYKEASRYWLGYTSPSRNLFREQSWSMDYFPRVEAAGQWAEDFGEDYTLESTEADSDVDEVNALLEYAMDGYSPEDVQSYAYEQAKEYGDVGDFFTQLYRHVVGQDDGPQAGELLSAIYGSNT
ncbi:class I lysyl tRNA synthetase [Halogranum tailed virus 1]|uniref:Lysine--tRNA ligase n=1 Tax=Halogranum tailed virus 1 TaxID=1273749 RepID=R4T703_9CAUD|nr:class I lysyl tRNA synthetase [Halogranum tailed virus 1]AGM11494.1 class I lysyl tRNA synthetase [Halogranum tailed virus 1]